MTAIIYKTPTSEFISQTVNETFNGTRDDVFIWAGYNIQYGTHVTKVNPDEPLLKHQMEVNYNNGSQYLMEWNLDYMPSDSTTVLKRFLGFGVDRATHAGSFVFSAEFTSIACPGSIGLVVFDGKFGYGKSPQAYFDVAGTLAAKSAAIGGIVPDSSAQLDIQSDSKGFLPPRLSTEQRDAISSPAEGLMIYNVSTKKLNFYNGISWQTVTSG